MQTGPKPCCYRELGLKSRCRIYDSRPVGMVPLNQRERKVLNVGWIEPNINALGEYISCAVN